MMNMKRMLRPAAASALALMLAAAPVSTMAAETENLTGMETILDTSEELIDQTAEGMEAAHEGYLYVKAEDPMRAAISELAGNTDDMAWIQDAELLVQQVPNEAGGADFECTLLFNQTELYHLQISYDAQEEVLYAVCPELLDKAMAIPFGELSETLPAKATEYLSPEAMEMIGTLLTDLGELLENLPVEELQQDAMGYIGTVASYLTVEQGIATVTAGTLSAEANTVSYKISGEDMQVLIPQLLQLLSEDQILAEIMNSSFANDLVTLALQQSGADIQLTGSAVYSMIQSQLASMAEADYSGMYGFNLTVGTSAQGTPSRISLALETSGVTAELFSIDAVIEETNHAFELKLGPVLASAMGLDASAVSGFVMQGYLEQNMLNETLSINANGALTPVILAENVDIEQLAQGRTVGTLTVFDGEQSMTYDYYVSEEDESSMMDFYRNEDLWCTTSIDFYETEGIELEPIDTSDAMIVNDEESLAAYMRDAKVIRMLEKLADAGVPQGYVDMLTSSEASTESSRENVEEKDAAS